MDAGEVWMDDRSCLCEHEQHFNSASHLSLSEARISHFHYLEKNARHKRAESAYFAQREDIDLCTFYFI